MFEICFLVLVVNLNVFVEEKIRFKIICVDDDGVDGIFCKVYGVKIIFVFVCFEVMIVLL